MPQFKVIAKEVKKAGRKSAVSQELIDSYKPYIEKLSRKDVGVLEFGKNEKINIGRKALQAASEELKKFIKVRRPRGATNVLQFERITAAQAKKKRARKGTETEEPKKVAKKQPKPSTKKKSAKKSG